MTEAPERIWVELTPIDFGSSDCPFWTVKSGIADIQWVGATEYVRADLPPKVKPLEWHKSHKTPWLGDWHTMPTNYTVRCADENGWKWQGPGAMGYAYTPEAAQAAAQADYETRILAALVQP